MLLLSQFRPGLTDVVVAEAIKAGLGADLLKVPFCRERLEAATQKAERKGEAKMLMRLLELRFGKLPKETRRKVAGANTETLAKWAERLLKAKKLRDVLL
jgi:hypothetical protein